MSTFIDKQKNEDRPVEISFIETPELIVEQVLDVRADDAVHAEHEWKTTTKTEIQGTKYCIYNKITRETEFVEEVILNDVLYRPVNNQIVRKGRILLPTGVLEYGRDLDLVNEMREFFHRYFQVPDFYEDLLPYIVLFYWVSDKFPFVPYIHFLGLPSTGKTTALEVVGSLCYKAVKASGAITLASLFRVASCFKGTILLNEFSLGSKGSEEYHQFLQLLKSGVEDDPIFRIEGEGKRSIEVFDIKSPRLFASQDPITDAALQSRTIMINMEPCDRELPLYRLGDFDEKAQKLRNKLLLWRFRHLGLINLSEIEYGIKELKTFGRRVQQALTPIYYLADEDTKDAILKLIKKQEEETIKERIESLEGQIFFKIHEKVLNKEEISLKEISGTINAEREEEGYKSLISERRIGGIVRKVLGFNIEKTGHDKKSVVAVNTRKFVEICKYYGVSPTCSASTASTAKEELEDMAVSEGGTLVQPPTDNEKVPSEDVEPEEIPF